MALSTILLLSLLLLIIPSPCIIDPTSVTLAISQATGNVCSVTPGSKHHSIQCTTVQESGGHNRSFTIDPTLSFHSISGGHNFICSLRSGDASSRGGMNQQVKCIYSGPTVFTELSVGAQHVATIEGDPRKMQTIQVWRLINDVLQSLPSGDVFPCEIDGTHEAHCWGPQVKFIVMRYKGMNKRSVSSGGSPMCGLNMSGHVCSGDQLILPPGEAFEFTNLAIRLSPYCAIWQKHRTVICWVQDGSYFPMGSTKFEFLVAGGDLTCGLITDSSNVLCWVLNGRNLSAVTLPLPQISHGVCIPDETFCSGGVLPHLGNLCGDLLFTSLAIRLSCAIWQKHRTVICWVQDGSYFPVGSTRFEFLVEGDDLTCGLITDALNMVCSGLNRRNLSAVTPPLPQISHGVCIPDETLCSCGVRPHSGNLCGESGITCKGLDTCTIESFELLAAPSLTTWERQRKWWFMFAIFGAVFSIAVVCFLSYLI